MLFNVIFASFNAFKSSSMIFSLWCWVVAFGENPVPGGVIYVSLGLAKISPSEVTIPTPNLFAEPSIPNAINFFYNLQNKIDMLLVPLINGDLYYSL